MYEEIFKDFFNNRSNYTQYVDPATGLLMVAKFAEDNDLGSSHIYWRELPSIKFDPSWNLTALSFKSLNLGKCDLSSCHFKASTFETSYFSSGQSTNQLAFTDCRFLSQVSFRNTEGLKFNSCEIDSLILVGVYESQFINIRKLKNLYLTSPLGSCHFEDIQFTRRGTNFPDIRLGNHGTEAFKNILFRNLEANFLIEDNSYGDIFMDGCIFERATIRNFNLPAKIGNIQFIDSSIEQLSGRSLSRFSGLEFIRSSVSNLVFDKPGVEYQKMSGKLRAEQSVINNIQFDSQVKILGRFDMPESNISDSDFRNLELCEDANDRDCIRGAKLERHFLSQNARFRNTPFRSPLQLQAPTPSPAQVTAHNFLVIGVPVIGGVILLALIFLILYRRHKEKVYRNSFEGKVDGLTRALAINDVEILKEIDNMAMDNGVKLPFELLCHILSFTKGFSTDAYSLRYHLNNDPSPEGFEISNYPGQKGLFIRFCDTIARTEYRRQNILNSREVLWKAREARNLALRLLEDQDSNEDEPLLLEEITTPSLRY